MKTLITFLAVSAFTNFAVKGYAEDAHFLFTEHVKEAKQGNLTTSVIPMLLNTNSELSQKTINQEFVNFCSKSHWQENPDGDIVEAFLRRVSDTEIIDQAFLAFCKGLVSLETGTVVAETFLRHWAPSKDTIKAVIGLPYIVEGRWFAPVNFLHDRCPDVLRSLRNSPFWSDLRNRTQDNPFLSHQVNCLERSIDQQ